MPNASADQIRRHSGAACGGRSAIAALLLALAACSSPAPPASDTASGTPAAAQPSADALAQGAPSEPAADTSLVPQVRYSCENGAAVLARYSEDADGESKVTLDLAGRVFKLDQAMSGSGARYETDKGMSPGKRLIWLTKAEDGILIEADLDDHDGSSETAVNCQEAVPER